MTTAQREAPPWPDLLEVGNGEPLMSPRRNKTVRGSLASGGATKLLMDIFVEERTGMLVVEQAAHASGTIYFVGGEPAYVERANDRNMRSLEERLLVRRALQPLTGERVPTTLLSLALRSSPVAVLEALRDEVRDLCRSVRDAASGTWVFFDGDDFIDEVPLTPVNTFGLVLEARRRTMQPQEIMRFANDVVELVPIPLLGFANATSRLRAFTAKHDLAELVDGVRRAGEIFSAIGIDPMMGSLVLQALVDTNLVQLSRVPRPVAARDRKKSAHTNARPALVHADGASLSQLAALPGRGGAELLALYLELKPERDADRILGTSAADGPAAIERSYQERLAELDPRAIPAGAHRPYLLARAEELRTKVERAYRARTGTQSRGTAAYELVEKIGVGGMAAVYRARPAEHPEQTVAIKLILPELRADPQFSQMFVDEARLARRVQHPNVVRVLSVGKGADDLYLVMEFVDGIDLADLVKRARDAGQPPAWPLVCRIVADACAGLHAAHTARDRAGTVTPILHRDVSAQNILVSRNGDVKLSDFGIAKALDKGEQKLEGENIVKGKIPYLAPELLAGHGASVRSDLYSMAMTIYHCLARLPFSRGENVMTMAAILREPLPPLSAFGVDVPPQLDEILMRAAARDPDERHASAQHFQLDLEELLVMSCADVDVAAWSAPLIGERVSMPMAPRSIASMPTGGNAIPAAHDLDVTDI
jgi:serine/threonine protein kinase